MSGYLKRLAVRLAFYPSLAFNRFMCLIGVWRRWDRIDEHVLLGALPSRADLERLEALGVGAIVNLCGEFAGHREEMARRGLVQLHLPTLDFHSPSADDMARGVEFILEQIGLRRGVYLHCKAGRGRSVTLAVCYLMARYALSPEAAYERIRRVRPQVDRGIAQRPAVREFAGRVTRRTPGAPG